MISGVYADAFVDALALSNLNSHVQMGISATAISVNSAAIWTGVCNICVTVR